jgi:hypothetical protein
MIKRFLRYKSVDIEMVFQANNYKAIITIK